MKKFLSVFLFLIIVTIIAFSVVGCTPDKQDSTGTMLLVIGEDTPVEYTVDLEKIEITNGLLSVLEYLKTTQKLEYSHQDGFLTSVGNLSQGEGHFIYVYTTIEKDFDVTQYAETIEYKGAYLTNAGVGAKDLTVEDGCTVYIGTIFWG